MTDTTLWAEVRIQIGRHSISLWYNRWPIYRTPQSNVCYNQIKSVSKSGCLKHMFEH